MTLRKTLAIAMAVGAISCLTISSQLRAASGMINYTASGTFAATPTSGSDTLKLAGEPFSVGISVSASTAPYKHGANWAAFHKLKLTGTVHSGLLGSSPVNIASSESTIIQAYDPGQYDTFTMEAPVKVVGISLTIKAVIVMPYGTFKNPLLQPFSPIALASGNATLTYSDGTNTTVLAIQSGTLDASAGSGSGSTAVSPVTLHVEGMEATTTHADGTWSVRPAGSVVDLSSSSDVVSLKFYATGVSGASEVHMQIGGEEAPISYAGASGYFPGLDEVIVQVPRSLAGRGGVDVSLTADGQTASPVHIAIQ